MTSVLIADACSVPMRRTGRRVGGDVLVPFDRFLGGRGRQMGRVAVTGGSGKLGGACVVDLVEHGWDVVNLDRVAPKRSPSMFVPLDLTDLGQVVEVLLAARRGRQ
jgi:hypothetical protein